MTRVAFVVADPIQASALRLVVGRGPRIFTAGQDMAGAQFDLIVVLSRPAGAWVDAWVRELDIRCARPGGVVDATLAELAVAG